MKSDQIENFPGMPASSPAKETPRKSPAPTMRMMRAGSEDIVVGENSSLEGSFETQGSMFVDGHLTRADLKTSLLSIGTSGSVEGSASVSRAEIAGSFDGKLIVSGEVILRSSSHITGEIQCGKLISHRGATVKAHVAVVDDEVDPTYTTEEARPSRAIALQRKITPAFIRRATTFCYGVFCTLGTIGIVSLLSR